MENNLVETNTVFQQTIRRTTPNGKHRNQIDFILVLTDVKLENISRLWHGPQVAINTHHD